MTVSPTTAALPSVLVMSRPIRNEGVVSLVTSATVTVGAFGATLSSTWACAEVMALRLSEVAMVFIASAIEACFSASTVTPASTLLRVDESLRLTVMPDSAALENWMARLSITAVEPAASETKVATCAAAFCTASAMGSLLPPSPAAIGS